MHEQEVSIRYWPQGKNVSAQYGKITVTVKDQKVLGDYVMRKLEVVKNQTDMPAKSSDLIITHFQYLRWQEDGIPNSTSAILEITNLVQKVQISTGNKPIVVMCK